MRRELAAGLGLAWLAGEVLLRRRPDWLPPAVQAVTRRWPYRPADLARFQQTYDSLHVADAWLGYRYRPNLDVLLSGHPDFSYRLRTDGQGLRNRHGRGPVDVALIGDSFAFGHGVAEADTFAARLEALSGRRVANLGVGGYGSLQGLRMLERIGLDLRPRLVLWQLFKDDLWGAGEFQRWLDSAEPDMLAWKRRQAQPPLQPERPAGPARSLRRLLFRHAVGYELLKYRLGRGPYRDRQRWPLRVSVAGQPLLLDLESNRLWGDFAAASVRLGWHLTREALLRAKTLVRQAGAELVVAVAPTKEEACWHLLAPRVGDPGRLAIGRIGRLVAQFCQAHEIACLDLLETFAGAARSGRCLYFSRDGHWNAAGHALAARTLRPLV